MLRRLFPVLVVVAACGTTWRGDPAIDGLSLDVRLAQGNARWPLHPDLEPRIRNVVERATAYWGISIDAVSGWRLVLTEGTVECAGSRMANGCTTDEDRTITLSANYSTCIESSALMHEIGHVALGDPNHVDPRWHDSEALRRSWEAMHSGLPGAPDCGNEPYCGQWQGF